MTDPLTPKDCDLSGNDWFQFHFVRLRKSKWWRRASDLARARNVMLWGEAYAAVPAGSLPDDDDELAEAAGFGFDVAAFIAAKAEIMAPWVLCSDGRWYHPTMCEVVLEAWHRLSESRRKEASRKAGQRLRVRGHGTGVPGKIDDVPAKTDDVPRDNAENGRDFSHRQTDRQDRTENPPTPLGAERDKSVFQKAFEAFPESGRASTSPEKAAAAWITAQIGASGEDRLYSAVVAFAASPFAKADGGKRVPSFHKWLADGRYQAFIGGSHTGHRGPAAWSGPPEWRAAVVSERGEAFAVSYLDPANWQDVPAKAVIGRTGTAAAKLREITGVFDGLGVEIQDPQRASA